jgi:hypothetical protein
MSSVILAAGEKGMVLRIFILLLLVLVSTPVLAEEMTIEQAYQAIPHERTPYNAQQSTSPAADAKYLDHLFFVTDMAMRARVQTLIMFHANKPEALEKYVSDVGTLLASFEMVQTPAHLKEVQELVVSAIKDQQAFFESWADTKPPLYDSIKQSYGSNPAVISAHQKLIKAYSLLKQAYPGETQHNTKAFFDHLCALDFI